MPPFKFLFALAISTLPAIVNAQNWTSPDGVVTVATPDSSQFQAHPQPPAPFIQLWVSNDETVKLGITGTRVPPGVELIQSSAEEGLEKEIDGKVTRLPTKNVNGHDVWHMRGVAPTLSITQAMVRHGDMIYKLMAVTDAKSSDDESVNGFINSLSLPEKPASSTPAPTAPPASDVASGGLDTHSLSKNIGGFAGLLGIILILYFAMKKKTPKNA